MGTEQAHGQTARAPSRVTVTRMNERTLHIGEVLKDGDVVVAVDGVRLPRPVAVDRWHRGPDAITFYDQSGTAFTYPKFTALTVQPRFA